MIISYVTVELFPSIDFSMHNIIFFALTATERTMATLKLV